MKPIYKSLALAAMTLQVSLALNAETNDGENVKEIALEAELLDSLRVELIAPNVSGARDLIKSGECEIDGSNLSVTLNAANWIKGATYRVQVLATFGTQTQVIYALDVTVPYYAALSDTPQEYEDDVTVVSTISDGDKSGADATVYAKDGDGNAHVTTPLSVGNGIATGSGSIASGYADGEGASIQAGGDGAIASGYVYGEGASIQAGSNGAIASGYAGEGAIIQANGDGAIASGYAEGDGSQINATGDGAVASGIAAEENALINAEGAGSIVIGAAYVDETMKASGEASQAFGRGTHANANYQMVLGRFNVEDTDGDYALIVGNGEGENARSNAFAINWNGNLVLFNAGTPVVLTPAKLATLIA